MLHDLREHIPLQQGLRRPGFCSSQRSLSALREHIPLQQGLRQAYILLTFYKGSLREHIPLQQGLRQYELK